MNSQDHGPRLPDNSETLPGARELFERSVGEIDVATGNRLRLMRREALSASAGRGRQRWLPALAVAMVLLLVGITWWPPSNPAPTGVENSNLAEASETVFPSDDDAELYAWLGEAPVAVDPQGTAL